MIHLVECVQPLTRRNSRVISSTGVLRNRRFVSQRVIRSDAVVPNDALANKAAIHLVSAWACTRGVALGPGRGVSLSSAIKATAHRDYRPCNSLLTK